LIDAAGNPFEPDGDLAVAKIVHLLGYDIRKVGVGLHSVEKFGVALAIKRAFISKMPYASCYLKLMCWSLGHPQRERQQVSWFSRPPKCSA
jgi:hypothetical protein